jgi:cell wall-associated NlpC family hydrolase
MSFQRLAAAAGFIAALVVNVDAFAAAPSPQVSVVCASDALEAIFASALIDNSAAFTSTDFIPAATLDEAGSDASLAEAIIPDPRQTLAQFAMTLRDIRYRRGGRAPSTGFDCSGFVHYVFAKALGIDLPDDSASQFRAGVKVARAELQTGDLVFFRTRGKYVSHVGIYLDHGRFIHSPTTGARVRVDELGSSYWAKRFAGAKRPDVLT